MPPHIPDFNSDPATQPSADGGVGEGSVGGGDRPEPWLWSAVVVLSLLLVALIATTVVVRVRDGRDDAPQAAGSAAALVRAQEAARLFFELAPTSVQQTTQQLLDLTTGSFHDEYAEQRAKLVKQVQRKQLSVTASVPERGLALEHLAGSKAQVLVAIDTTTSVGGQQETDNYRMRVVLTDVAGQWLVSGLEQVG